MTVPRQPALELSVVLVQGWEEDGCWVVVVAESVVAAVGWIAVVAAAVAGVGRVDGIVFVVGSERR